MTGDTEFTAQYSKTQQDRPIVWWEGCLNWLLLLFLLALIFIVIWCCLLGRCKTNCYVCPEEKTTEVIVPEPIVEPEPEPDFEPEPTIIEPEPPNPVKKFNDIKIEVTRRLYDNIGMILNLLKIKYSSYSGKFECDMLFINCGSSHNVNASKLKKYVENGGIVYISDLASEVISRSFPNTLVFGSSSKIGIVKASVIDDELKNYMGNTINVTFDMSGWSTINNVIKGDVLLLNNDNNLPVMVQIPIGKGKLYYTSFHNSAQTTGNERKMLQLLVLKQIAFLNDMTIQEVADLNGVDLNNL